MTELVAWCAKAHPHPAWSRFKRLDIEAEVPRLERWLRGVLRREPPAKKITAFWFGLFNPTDRDGSVRTELYVAGSTLYTGARSPIDWQCSPAYWPKSRYAHSEVLATIYRRAYGPRNSLGNDAEYPLALGYAAFAVAHLLRTLPRDLLLAGAAKRTAIVGFDDGDYVPAGVVKQTRRRSV